MEEEIMNKGSVIVYFGNGKGKSSSAIGHAICAAGMGQSVTIIQFLKGNNQKEIEFLKRLEPEVRLFSFEKNAEFFEELNEEQRQEEIQNIKNGLGFAKKVLVTGESTILVLDEILGLLEDKRWVLLANHYDRSFIRAGLASWLGKRLTKQDWTPSGYSTELVLNGKHVGNYFFCEQIKISDDRVNADYLLEVDTKAKTAGGYDDVYFLSSTTDNVFNIKDPEITTNGSEYNYVQSYINEVEKVLYDDAKYLDSNEGYKKYCDLESFVDWALIKELSKDYDGNFFTSCHMNLTNGILKMGPLWDFDLAFANNPFAELFGGGFGGGWGGGFGGGGVDYEYYNEPEGYHVLEADWLNRMMKDPEFRALLLEKVNLLIEHETEIDQYIDEQAALNINSFVVNETLWKTLGKSSWGWNGSTVEWNYTDATLREHYRNDIAKMKKFIKDRLAWMKNDLQ